MYKGGFQTFEATIEGKPTLGVNDDYGDCLWMRLNFRIGKGGGWTLQGYPTEGMLKLFGLLFNLVGVNTDGKKVRLIATVGPGLVDCVGIGHPTEDKFVPYTISGPICTYKELCKNFADNYRE